MVLKALVRSKISIGPLASEDAVNPQLRLRFHFRVVKKPRHLDVAPQPIRQFFPTIFALAILAQPRALILLQPRTDLAEMPGQPVALTLQINSQPAAWLNRAREQGQQPTLCERRTLIDVEAVCSS